METVVNVNYQEAKQQSVAYWRQRAERADQEVARLQKAWDDASDMIAAARMLWAAMEKLK